MKIRKATLADVEAISRICSDGWRETYKHLHTQDHINMVIEEYYNLQRVQKDVTECSAAWSGYWVAEEDETVEGCIGGGIDQDNNCHIYVFYVAPELKRRGIGTALLQAFTDYQIETYGIEWQWVTSVTEGNLLGLAFYEKQGFTFDFATENSQDCQLPKNLHYKRKVKIQENL
ncbi:GNAT family N-acetyltransferase [Streptococcus gallolyticus]|nr:GNAT family N-acetyltransferase [Streptococcus gallolyticus]MBY5041299.1 GNAT family N-acetyltransferase [Streptococcus gallolyticus]